MISDVDDSHGIFKSGWGLAAAGAVAIHTGCVAAALALIVPDNVEVVTGALAIEIGVEWTSPPIEHIDLPPGPEADASAASPAVVEQKVVVEQTDINGREITVFEDLGNLFSLESGGSDDRSTIKIAATKIRLPAASNSLSRSSPLSANSLRATSS